MHPFYCIPAVFICRGLLEEERGDCDIFFIGIVGFVSIVCYGEQCRISLLISEKFSLIGDTRSSDDLMKVP